MEIFLDSIKQIVNTAAQEELLPRFNKVKHAHKADGSIITEADIAVQQRIAQALSEQWPEIALLGEEMPTEEQQRLLASGQPLWILDPLDGTSNFAAGIPFFSVSLALLVEGRVSLGLVYDPLRDECFSAQQDQGAFLNGEALPVAEVNRTLTEAMALIDFKRLPPELATRLATEIPYASQRSFGSVALDWCWIAAGRCHVYLHGRQNIWDYAAGYLILHEAGGLATSLDGADVFVTELTPRSAVAALDHELYDEWLSWLDIG
jgi:myo-inositol-1(or 4)-monophosphatase